MRIPKVAVVGAGINGLVAANYLQRAGCDVTVIERSAKVGGACISASVNIEGQTQSYALGASVLGLMQDFVFEETGLSKHLRTFVPTHPKLVFFPGDQEPTWIYRNAADLDREIEKKWGERGDVEAFRADEDRVVRFLRDGYVNAVPPSIADAKQALGDTLTDLWISGTARNLLDHYLSSDKAKIYMAMTVTESGPVSLDDPYSAFTLPMMDSGSIFGSYYGFVNGGIWRVTEQLDAINSALGISCHVATNVHNVDLSEGRINCAGPQGEKKIPFDYLILATDPMTASRLVGTAEQLRSTENQQFRGSSGKLNLMFRSPVRWKHGSDAGDSDAAFRFLFSVETIEDFEAATTGVMQDGVEYEPGFAQIYCEGAAMRQMQYEEPFDRLAVFFKNLGLSSRGDDLTEVESQVKDLVLSQVENPEDCAWSRLLTPRDMQQLFLFPGGNLDHTMLVGGQTFFDRNYSSNPATEFYRFGDLENVYLCGSGTYPCGSVAGTPGYMCSQQLLRAAR